MARTIRWCWHRFEASAARHTRQRGYEGSHAKALLMYTAKTKQLDTCPLRVCVPTANLVAHRNNDSEKAKTCKSRDISTSAILFEFYDSHVISGYITNTQHRMLSLLAPHTSSSAGFKQIILLTSIHQAFECMPPLFHTTPASHSI